MHLSRRAAFGLAWLWCASWVMACADVPATATESELDAGRHGHDASTTMRDGGQQTDAAPDASTPSGFNPDGDPGAAPDGGRPHECSSARDCAAPTECQESTPPACIEGICHYVAVPDGLPCDDGDDCTREDACISGSCAGAPFACGDPLQLVDISGIDFETCAIDGAGALYCWGPWGAAGVPGGTLPNTPQRFGNDRWRTISVGTSHACGIRADGSFGCWGSNCAGQLGDPVLAFQSEVVQVGTDTDWLRVAAGGGHTCGIRRGGELQCWGGADVGSTGCPGQPAAVLPGRWKAVAAHFYSISALRDDGTLWRMRDVWRPDTDADAGSSTVWELGPLTQLGGQKWRSISSGLYAMETCGVLEDDRVACVSFDSNVEKIIEGVQPALMVASRYQGCAVTTAGVQCWGRNDYGQTDPANLRSFLSPLDLGVVNTLSSEPGWTKVTAGWSHGCGLREGRAYCWGSDPNGVSVLGRSGVTGVADVQPIEL